MSTHFRISRRRINKILELLSHVDTGHSRNVDSLPDTGMVTDSELRDTYAAWLTENVPSHRELVPKRKKIERGLSKQSISNSSGGGNSQPRVFSKLFDKLRFKQTTPNRRMEVITESPSPSPRPQLTSRSDSVREDASQRRWTDLTRRATASNDRTRYGTWGLRLSWTNAQSPQCRSAGFP